MVQVLERRTVERIMSESLPELAEYVIRDVSKSGKELGRGAYGTVEEVIVSGVKCAGKLIHDVLVDTVNAEDQGYRRVISRFIDECSTMSRLRNPHVVQFLGVHFDGSTSALPMLVMEYLPTDLDSVLNSYPDIPAAMKVEFLLDVAKGLTYLHGLYLIHRDLTARNVLLNSAMVAKIADFGVARIVNLKGEKLSQQLTKGPGNPFYMPPEAQSIMTDFPKSLDVFSFGVLILYTITQKFPQNLLPATYTDDTGELRARTEVQRRQEHINRAYNLMVAPKPESRLIQILEESLSNQAKDRPDVIELLRRIQEIRDEMTDRFSCHNKLDLIQLLQEAEEDNERKKAILAYLEQQAQHGHDGAQEEQRLLGMERILQEREREIVEKERELTESKSRLDDKTAECQELRAELTLTQGSLHQRITDLEAQLALTQGNLHQHITDLEAARQQVQRLTLELQRVTEECNDVISERNHFQSIITEKKIKALKLEEKLSTEQQRWQREKESYELRLESLVTDSRTLSPLFQPSQPSGIRVELPMVPKACTATTLHMDSAQTVRYGNDKAIFGGGDGLGDDGKKIAFYDKSRNVWNSLGIYDMKLFALAKVKDQAMLVGGYHEDKDEYSGKIAVWNHNGKYWMKAYTPMPTPRGEASAVGFKQWLVVAGGFNKTGLLTVVEVLNTSPGDHQWSTAEPLPQPMSRMQMTPPSPSAGDENCFWYLVGGGRNLTGKKAAFAVSLNQLMESCEGGGGGGGGGRVWEELPDPPFSCCGAALVHGYLLVVGGKDQRNQPRDEIHMFLPGTMEWLQVARLPTARHSCSCACFADNSFVVAGGREAEGRSGRVDMFTVPRQ